MTTGRDLGLMLRLWLEEGVVDLEHPQGLANRLVDALGAEEGLKGPLRDLVGQPLLRRALRQEGAGQRAALEELERRLRAIYAPQVLDELLGLLEAATGLDLPLSEPDPGPGSGTPPAASAPAAPTAPPGPFQLRAQLISLGPGVALAALAALVWRWCAGEADALLFGPRGWNGGVVLVLLLAVVQALTLGPLRRLRREWPLELADAAEPRQAWRWIAAPWIHHAHGEAVLHLLLLLLILGPSPLGPAAVIFRYALTSLATALPAVLVAQRRTPEGRWDGAAGAVSALIGLGAGASLLHWRVLEYRLGEYGLGTLAVPAWVLLVVYGVLQLGLQLPRRSEHDGSRPIDRLLSCQWWWGLVLGLGWALITRLGSLLASLPALRPGS
jgi:hypothetical protein